jgi:hypothetical protein
MSSASKILSPRALRTFNRLGDMMIPREGEMPAFSELGCLEHVDDVVAHAPQEDIKTLNALLVALSFAPDFVLRWLLALVAAAPNLGGPGGTLLRQLDVGLRSVIVTLYYSGRKGRAYTGRTPLEIIGFSLNTIRD